LNRPRTCPGIAVLDGVMYVVGGEFGDQRYHTSIEAYKPSVDTWTLVTKIPFNNYSSNYNIYIFKEYICKNLLNIKFF